MIRNGDGFYRASRGLDKNHHLNHLFRENIAVLACRKRFYFSGKGRSTQLLGEGWLFHIPPPNSLRTLLAKTPYARCAPKSLKHFVNQDYLQGRLRRRLNRTVNLKVVIQKFRHSYRLTDEIIVLLSHLYRKPVSRIIELVGSDRGLPIWEFQAVQQETVLQFASHIKKLRFLLERIKWLDAMRVAYEAPILAFQMIRKRKNKLPTSKCLRALGRLKPKIVDNPFEVAKSLKDLAHECRAYYFGGERPRNALICDLDDEDCLQFSYIARSLPPPLGDTVEELKEKYNALVGRLTTETPEVPGWKPWVREYLDRFKPSGNIRIMTEPSTSASIGYPRRYGGHALAYQHLVLFGLVLRISKIEGESFAPFLRDCPTVVLPNDALLSVNENNKPVFRTRQCFTQLLAGGEKPGRRRDVKKGKAKAPKPPPSVYSELFARRKALKAKGSAEMAKLGITGKKRDQRSFVGDDAFLQWIFKSAADISNGTSQFFNELMMEASDYILSNVITKIPVLPIFADEKGLKTRMPTATLTAASLFLQPLRKAADAFIINDNRIAGSLGKPHRAINLSKQKGPWCSLDLTVATDMHPFWLTRTFYEEIVDRVPELKPLLKYFPQLFGPRKLLEPERVGGPPIPEAPVITWNGADVSFDEIINNLFGFPNVSSKWKDIDLETTIKLLVEFGESYIVFLQNLEALPGTETKGGAMMGDATSWALLPLVNIYAAEQSGLYALDTCGDDAIIPNMTEEKQKQFDSISASLGAIKSDKKTFKHPSRGIFKEIPYIDGKAQPYELLSFWVAPYGGTKGEMHWFNQPSAYRGFCHTQELPLTRTFLRGRGLWKYSKFYHEWMLAERLGIPTGSPEFMGGIDLPIGRPDPVYGRDQWSLLLSTMSKLELAQRGLTLIPPSGPRLHRIVTDAAAEIVGPHLTNDAFDFPEGYQGFSNPHITDVLAKMQNPFSVTAIYGRRFEEIRKAPNITNIAKRLKQRLRRVADPPGLSSSKLKRLKSFSARGLRSDLEKKRENLFVKDLDLSAVFLERNFGFVTLNPSPLTSTKPWFTHGLGW